MPKYNHRVADGQTPSLRSADRIVHRSFVMNGKELELRRTYRRHTSAELRTIRACRSNGSTGAGVIDEMLAERDFWRRFWTSGIVAWISLGLSIAAFVFSLIRCK